MKKSLNLLTLTLLMMLGIQSVSLNGSAGTLLAQVEAPAISLHQAIIMKNIDVIKQHIQAGSDLNELEQMGGSSPLITAAAFGNNEAAKLLIDAGANLNIQNNDGSTALHTAAFFCRTEIVKMLLEKGADKTIKNNYNKTALESVTASFEEVKPVYEAVGAAMKPLGIILDFDYLKETRPIIAEMLK